MRNKFILVRNLATLCIVCNVLYWTFPVPPFLWRIGLVLLSIYAVVYNDQKTKVEKSIIAFAGFNLLHFIISLLWQIPSTTQIGNILYALLSFSLFVFLGKNGVMTNAYFSIIGMCLLVAFVAAYYHMEAYVIEELMLDADADVTNNATSGFLFLLPMLFFIKKEWQKWLMLVICLFYLLAGAKRGNIIAAIIPTLLFVRFELKDSKHSLFRTTLIIIAIIALGYTLYNWFATNDFLMHRFEKAIGGNSTGRDILYAHAWQTWCSSDSFFNLLFGYGFDGILHQPLMEGMHAHNDWLEILVNYGIIGILFYLVIFFNLLGQFRSTKFLPMQMVLLSVTLIWLFKSFYSMGFTAEGLSVMMVSLGTVVGKSSCINNKI